MHVMAVICSGHMLIKLLEQLTILETAICLELLLLVRGLLSPTHMARTTKMKCPNLRSDAPATNERIESSAHERGRQSSTRSSTWCKCNYAEMEDLEGEEDMHFYKCNRCLFRLPIGFVRIHTHSDMIHACIPCISFLY